MPEPARMLRFRVEAAGLRLLGALTRPLPLRRVAVPGRWLGVFAFDVLRLKRRLTLRNLALALGEAYDEAERVRIARRCYRFFGGLACEILAMPRLRGRRLEDYVVLENPEVLDRALDRGRGVVLVSGHLGNWELMGGAISASGRPLTMYVGQQRNPETDALLNASRRSLGTTTVPKGPAARAILRALRRGDIVAMLSDQHHSRKRHYVRFFGWPVSTPPGPASMARRSGAPLVFGWCVREGPFRYRTRLEELAYATSDDEEWDILAISQAIAGALERAVRRHPDQYFWMHHRWRGLHKTHRFSAKNRAFLEGRAAPGPGARNDSRAS